MFLDQQKIGETHSKRHVLGHALATRPIPGGEAIIVRARGQDMAVRGDSTGVHVLAENVEHIFS